MRSAQILRRLIAAFDAGDEAAQTAVLADIPQPWQFVWRAWDALRNYVFLEYYFLYAFNDYLQVADSIFANEHEGDNEGCCVVFDRRDLEDLAAGTKTLNEIVAHTVITSVHEEFNDNDELKRLPLDRDRARDDLVVYVAAGSHATLPHGRQPRCARLRGHPDGLSGQGSRVGVAYPWRGTGDRAPPVDHGHRRALRRLGGRDVGQRRVHGSGARRTDPGPLAFPSRRVVTPLSAITGPDASVNAYQAALASASANVSLADLTRRAFPGKWGAHDGLRDHSPKWENKTARYFRKFVHSGDIRTNVIL